MSAESVLATLRELAPVRRHHFWSNVTPRYFRVHDTGAGGAEVTEGTLLAGLFWERSRYDWSRPGVVTATVLDSNVFEPGSSFELRARPNGATGTAVEMTIRRTFRRGFKGRIAAIVNRLGGRRLFGWYLGTVLRAVGRETTPKS